MQSIKSYILERVDVVDAVPGFTECWEWKLARNGDGYGLCFVKGWPASAHRVAYLGFVGEIPDGLEIDHLCRNTSCVNPEHLEAVTRAVNIQRMHFAKNGRSYSLYKRSSDGLWVTSAEVKSEGTRKRRVFTARTSEAAVEKMLAYLQPSNMGGVSRNATVPTI